MLSLFFMFIYILFHLEGKEEKRLGEMEERKEGVIYRLLLACGLF